MSKIRRPSPPIVAPISPAQRRWPIAIGVLLVAAALALYWPVLGFGFTNYDDPEYVTQNAHVLRGLNWETIRWASTSLDAGFWQPVTWLSYLLDTTIWRGNPGGFHLTNIVLHAVNSVLLFAWLRRLTGKLWHSAVVAALFVVHPLHVEPVAWVASRKDVLSTCFGLMALMAYTHYAKATIGSSKSRLRYYCLALLFFALSLMSKTMLVTFPLLLLLIDHWPLERFSKATRWQLLREKIPFMTLSVVSGILTIRAEQALNAIGSSTDFPLESRLANATTNYALYLWQTLWPTNLAVYYPYPTSLSMMWISIGGLVLAGIIAVLVSQFRQRDYLIFGWGWYVISLLPVIGLVQIGSQAHADRYTYVPLIGVFIVLVWMVAEVAKRFKLPPVVMISMAIALLEGCAIRTANQLRYWRNSETLFTHALAVTQNNHVAYHNLGQYYDKRGVLPEAIRLYREALSLNPDYIETLLSLGEALVANKEFEAGLSFIRKAVALYPDDLKTQTSLAWADMETGHAEEAEPLLDGILRVEPTHTRARDLRGRLYALRNQSDRALAEYLAALEINRDDATALAGIAAVFVHEGRLAEAAEKYERVVLLNAADADARNQLGSVLIQLGHPEEAAKQLQLAIHSNPALADAYDNLGVALSLQGNYDEAVSRFREAMRLAPGEANTHYNLANVLAMRENLDAAVAEYSEALRLDPKHLQARLNLGVTLATQGRRPEARAMFQEILRQDAGNTSALEQLQKLDAAP